MIQKLLYVVLAVVLSMSGINIQQVSAEERTVTIEVDDTVIEESETHRFIYHGSTDSDPHGSNGGWVADNGGKHSNPLVKSQHWVWAEYEIAKNQTYDFTFEGTGVELMGLKSTDTKKMNFQLDGGDIVTNTIPGNRNDLVTLYKIENISDTNERHTVKVTLPEGCKGLQVSYAKVFRKETVEESSPAEGGDGSTEEGSQGQPGAEGSVPPAPDGEGQPSTDVVEQPTNKSSDRFVIVDNTAIDPSWPHHFAFQGTMDSDPNGSHGNWVSDTKRSLITTENPRGTHNWYYTENSSLLPSQTYTFTFVGSGIVLMGEKNEQQNTFTFDGVEETLDIQGQRFRMTKLFEKKDLPVQRHTVQVSLKRGTGLEVAYAKVFDPQGENPAPVEVVPVPPGPQPEPTTVAPTEGSVKSKITTNTTDGEYNAYTYTDYGGAGPKAWHVSAGEAWVDLGSNDPRAEEVYYEFPFIGNRVDIFAIKSPKHGKFKVIIDGEEAGVVDLYDRNRGNAVRVFSKGNLEERPHTMKIVTLNQKTGSNLVNQVSYIEVYHQPYLPTSVDMISELNLIVEETHELVITPTPSYANEYTVTMDSSKPDVVSVEDGVLTAKKAGDAVVTVNVTGLEPKTIAVHVDDQTKKLTGSFVDDNVQWTQDKKEVARALDVKEKTIHAWKNDKALAELVVHANLSSLTNVALEVSSFTDGTNTLASEDVNVNFVKSTLAYTGMPGWNYQPHKYPQPTKENRKESSDIIYSNTPVDIAFDHIQPVWVEVNVPKNTKPGVYTGTITVTSSDVETPLVFTVKVDVADAVLPDPTEFKNSFDIELWQYPYTSAEYYGLPFFSDAHKEVLKKEMALYKSLGGHAITATFTEDAWARQTFSENPVHYPSMVKWTLVEGQFTGERISNDFRFEYDFTHFDEWVKLNKELGIADKIACYGIVPWHGNFTYYVGEDLRQTHFTNGSDTYDRVWTDFLEHFIDHVKNEGWLDNIYIGIDERGITATPFDLVDRVAASKGVTLKTTGAIDKIGQHAVLARRMTELTVGDTVVQDHRHAFETLLRDRNAQNKKTTLYSCTGHKPGNFSLSAPAESYWSILFAYKSNTKGFLRWAYDAWVADPLTDVTHSSFEAGDPFLVYPEPKGTVNPGIKNSIRLSKMAQGIRDVNKLILIAEQQPTLQEDVNNLLNSVKTTYPAGDIFLTDAGKEAVTRDMNQVQTDLVALTAKYVELKGPTPDETKEPEETTTTEEKETPGSETETGKQEGETTAPVDGSTTEKETLPEETGKETGKGSTTPSETEGGATTPTDKPSVETPTEGKESTGTPSTESGTPEGEKETDPASGKETSGTTTPAETGKPTETETTTEGGEGEKKPEPGKEVETTSGTETGGKETKPATGTEGTGTSETAKPGETETTTEGSEVGKKPDTGKTTTEGETVTGKEKDPATGTEGTGTGESEKKPDAGKTTTEGETTTGKEKEPVTGTSETGKETKPAEKPTTTPETTDKKPVVEVVKDKFEKHSWDNDKKTNDIVAGLKMLEEKDAAALNENEKEVLNAVKSGTKVERKVRVENVSKENLNNTLKAEVEKVTNKPETTKKQVSTVVEAKVLVIVDGKENELHRFPKGEIFEISLAGKDIAYATVDDQNAITVYHVDDEEKGKLTKIDKDSTKLVNDTLLVHSEAFSKFVVVGNKNEAKVTTKVEVPSKKVVSSSKPAAQAVNHVSETKATIVPRTGDGLHVLGYGVSLVVALGVAFVMLKKRED